MDKKWKAYFSMLIGKPIYRKLGKIQDTSILIQGELERFIKTIENDRLA